MVLDVNSCQLTIFNAADASITMKWNPEFIPRIFKSVVNYVKSRIISFSLLFFIAVFRMALQSYTYIIYIALFPFLDVIGNHQHKLEEIYPPYFYLGPW